MDALRRLLQSWYANPAFPDPPVYVAPPTTQEHLEYADLAIIDLAQATTLAGRKALAGQLVAAMRAQGFFYAVNHGYTADQTNRMFSIADLTLDEVGEEEKLRYCARSGHTYEGYKPRKTWHIDGVGDQIEQYTVGQHVLAREHPTALRPYLPELDAFSRHNTFNILHPVLRLMALGLELPEETLVQQHSYDSPSESSVRFMKYYPYSEEEEKLKKNVWLKGHTDIGSVTVLWSQPVGGLQILSPDGKWRWVRHMENAVVINAGDVMTFLCGGFYPATRHRVVRPPEDQLTRPRLGVFFFALANDDVKLVPHQTQSPVLQRVGVQRLCEDGDAPTMEQWRKTRVMQYGSKQVELVKSETEEGVEEEMVGNVKVKYFN
ncbi:unnamed protein product [Mycena citricolor]|uniref:Fe2OG dioxygenase domain-containing protein n=1 Tax=Mycena citricolor TaxID=2018698 RepID=A0AAD2HRI1_9AGAR|nr:unnamed protein product [Mycena citricolor]